MLKQVSVNALKKQGYVVQPTPNAVNCTDVRRNAPFWFVHPINLEENDAPEKILDIFECARHEHNEFVLTVAGSFSGKDVFPFILVSQEELQQVQQIQARAELAARAIREATHARAQAQRDIQALMQA